MTDSQDEGVASEPASSGEAFGFKAAAKDEKYNTEYLVANLQKEKQRTILIIAGGVAAAIAGIALWAMLGSDEATPQYKPARAPAADESPAPAK